MPYRRLRFPDGTIELFVSGPVDAPDLLLFHVGTPSAGVTYPALTRAAAAAGMRVATYSRGGYGRSDRRPGRSVADEADISARVADALGHARFFVAGWSGGGPAALAGAALLPDRVRACLALASIAPRVEAGPAWEAIVKPEELAEWEALASGAVDRLMPEYLQAASIFGRMTVRRLVATGGPPDERAGAYALEAEVQGPLVRSMRRAFLRGHEGYLDDNLSHARDWGFRVSDIRVPVVVRHGARDRIVGITNGEWLAATIPGAQASFHADAGHGSIALPWEDVVGELAAAAR